MPPIPVVNIASSEFKANPIPFHARLRSDAPVYRALLHDKQNSWLITRYNDVLAVLKDERFGKDRFRAKSSKQISKQPWMPNTFMPLTRNMLDLDVPDHTWLRGLVQKAFMPRLIENMRKRVQVLSDELLDAAQTRGRMDLVHDYARPIPTTIIAEMLGVPAKDRHKLHRWSAAIVTDSSKIRTGWISHASQTISSFWLWSALLPWWATGSTRRANCHQHTSSKNSRLAVRKTIECPAMAAGPRIARIRVTSSCLFKANSGTRPVTSDFGDRVTARQCHSSLLEIAVTVVFEQP